MTEPSVWSIAGAILASLGGGAAIVAALLKFWGSIIAKRILQREENALAAGLEELKQELGLSRLSYEKHVLHVVEYYAMFYKSYLLSQRTARADLIRHPDRKDLDTKQDKKRCQGHFLGPAPYTMFQSIPGSVRLCSVLVLL